MSEVAARAEGLHGALGGDQELAAAREALPVKALGGQGWGEAQPFLPLDFRLRTCRIVREKNVCCQPRRWPASRGWGQIRV